MEHNMADEQLEELRQALEEKLLIADFQFSLFVAALSSYKHDTVVRPFPPMFMRQESNEIHDKRDFKTLESQVDRIPSLRAFLKNDLRTLVEPKALSLLHWCLFQGTYTLKLCNPNLMDEIQQKTKQNVPTPKPKYIFEILHPPESNEKFNVRRGDRKLIYGYHGSNIENFHSILNYGLQGHMSKNALFGEGTYLSSELAISLMYSPHGRGWEHSVHGSSLSCVAVAEMIDDPSVKCQTKNTERTKNSRSKIRGSEGGEIPETYYVVRNNDVMRVKYLLLYCGQPHKRKKSSWSWFHQHKFGLLMFLYALMLVLIALYNSKAFWAVTRRYLFSIKS